MSYSYKEKIAQWQWCDLDTVVSTNDEIKAVSQNDFPVVISAKKQTGGRGRRGRKWQGLDGNLYFTLSLDIPHIELSRYVSLIGLSLAKTVKSLCPSADITIKWPNDVFLNHQKLSGILLENISNTTWAVGIGVNIVASPQITDQPYKATSLQENNIKTTRISFLRRYLEQLSSDIKTYQSQGFQPIKEQWLAMAAGLNQEITIKNDRTTKKGLFLTLDDDGYLILKTEVNEEKILAGDLFL